MKKFTYTFMVVLIGLSLISCNKTEKKETSPDEKNSENASSSFSSISCSMSKTSLSSGSVNCDGSVCTFSKASTEYKVKVSFSGPSSTRTIITSYDSDMTFSDTSNSSYFYISGKTPSNGNSNSVQVLVRDLDLCKKTESSSNCDIDGKNSSPSAKNSKWDKTCSLTIKTNTSLSSSTAEDITNTIKEGTNAGIGTAQDVLDKVESSTGSSGVGLAKDILETIKNNKK